MEVDEGKGSPASLKRGAPAESDSSADLDKKRADKKVCRDADQEMEDAGANSPVKKKASSFDTERLKVYYLSLFPYKQMFSWLSYGNDPEKASENPAIVKDYFYRREFSFTMEHDVYIRYLSFRNAEELEREIQKKQPHKIDIGAVYSLPAIQHNAVQGSAFKPLERELVFDIDLDDYNDVRVGCSKDTMWEKGSWQYMSLAIKVVDAALREDFGFENILWVFSGRRGVHCWVCDKRALQLEDRERTAVVNYLTLLTSEDASKVAAGLTSPLHPSLKRAMPLLDKVFEDMVCNPEGQDAFSSPEKWEKVLKMIPDAEIQDAMRNKWKKSKETSLIRWRSLKATVKDRVKKRGKAGWQLKRALDVVTIVYTYPRLDVNVSTHRNHLLKSPFVVHPKTGKVCVPILDVANSHKFDPDSVPNLGTLMDELDNNPKKEGQAAYSRTSMKTYVDGFEKQFLKPLHAAILKTQIEEKQKQAALTGDW